MADQISKRALGRAVTSAPVLAAIALMVFNDHVLKHAGLLPGLVTGKLSDFAFLFFAPIVLAFALRATSRAALFCCFAVPGALLTAINVSPQASLSFSGAMSHLVPMQLWPDPTDLVALLSLPLAWRHLVSQPSTKRQASFAHAMVTAVAALSCVATSPPHPNSVAPQPTHEPVYMSWEELRTTSVQVEAPRAIGERGKLLIVDQFLFLSEPGQGIHVFDDSDPEQPIPLLFIRIPGNIDIAVKGDLLYADSYVDLLTFKIDLDQQTITLIARLEDQFAYDPYQGLKIPEDEPYYMGTPDRYQGVVIGLRKIDHSAKKKETSDE